MHVEERQFAAAAAPWGRLVLPDRHAEGLPLWHVPTARCSSLQREGPRIFLFFIFFIFIYFYFYYYYYYYYYFIFFFSPITIY